MLAVVVFRKFWSLTMSQNELLPSGRVTQSQMRLAFI